MYVCLMIYYKLCIYCIFNFLFKHICRLRSSVWVCACKTKFPPGGYVYATSHLSERYFIRFFDVFFFVFWLKFVSFKIIFFSISCLFKYKYIFILR